MPVIFIGSFIMLLVLFAIICIIAFAAVNPKVNSEKGTAFYRRICCEAIDLLARLLRVRISVDGADKLPDKGRFLLVCNHLNNIDPAVILHALPDAELGFISKKELYEKLPLISRAMHKLHCLPIDRENNRSAAKTVIEAVKLIKADKASVAVFPEGKVSRSGELLPFRAGSLKIATRAGVPIVICTLLGTPQAASRLLIRKNTIYFDILSVIPASEVSSSDTAALAATIYEKMHKNLEKRRSENPELNGGNEVAFGHRKN